MAVKIINKRKKPASALMRDCDLPLATPMAKMVTNKSQMRPRMTIDQIESTETSLTTVAESWSIEKVWQN